MREEEETDDFPEDNWQDDNWGDEDEEFDW